MNNPTPIQILMIAARDYDLNFEIKDEIIKIGSISWDCTHESLTNFGLQLITHLISKGAQEPVGSLNSDNS